MHGAWAAKAQPGPVVCSNRPGDTSPAKEASSRLPRRAVGPDPDFLPCRAGHSGVKCTKATKFHCFSSGSHPPSLAPVLTARLKPCPSFRVFPYRTSFRVGSGFRPRHQRDLLLYLRRHGYSASIRRWMERALPVAPSHSISAAHMRGSPLAASNLPGMPVRKR
jgi:hypothetical protein